MMQWRTHKKSSSAEWEISVLSSAKTSSLTSIFVFLFFALKCATLKEVYILTWLDVDSVPHVSKRIFGHC